MVAKVPVTKRALLQRINRALKKRDEVLKASRGSTNTLGQFYRIDTRLNALIEGHVDPEALGRELGVLEAWEVVAE